MPSPVHPPQLVEVINEDYSDYISLSGKLANVDGAVVRMRKPLMELKARPMHRGGAASLCTCSATMACRMLLYLNNTHTACTAFVRAGEAERGAGAGQGGAGSPQPGQQQAAFTYISCCQYTASHPN